MLFIQGDNALLYSWSLFIQIFTSHQMILVRSWEPFLNLHVSSPVPDILTYVCGLIRWHYIVHYILDAPRPPSGNFSELLNRQQQLRCRNFKLPLKKTS